ncbi:hypothetical protein AciPR4_1383 [Terriglobus saanensis SP1PR4]|uniref:Uncharacterized protein n=1 Tax=Terriglobus saanensis (strain ATCC BAA-1853 / DSM 23119 / SP1PR4) TaxID=401053 RepID=E8V051_TERSS|nr:hypothetical protein AciPR4_1383 [Terriglobus saanensis SP1PR4]
MHCILAEVTAWICSTTSSTEAKRQKFICGELTPFLID